MTKYTIIPTSEKLIKTPAGPPSLNAFPEPTRRPGPMIPVELFVVRFNLSLATSIELCKGGKKG
jgi:hypothetical protein